MSERDHADVLVVGAGPTGLALAIELLRLGARPRIVDELAAPVVYSKAAVVHARTMEHFDAMGVAGAIVERSRIIRATNVFAGGRRVAHVALDPAVDSAFPHAYGIAQHDTEEVLTAHLARQGIQVERGARLESFTQDAGGVRATIARGGATETIDARFLVGCDGAHSVVRKALGFSFEGAPYEERLIQTDARIEFAERFADDEILIFLHERGPAMAFPLFRDGRYRLMLLDVGSGGSGDAPPPEPPLEDFQRGLDERQIAARVLDPVWTVSFRIHHRHTVRLREGSVFLAGDAAHIHSPVGGQGMNTGIQDAVNLAWKLALAARGRAQPAVLDAYERERLPVIRDLVAKTDRATRALETVVKLRNPLAVALRDQLMSAVTRLGAVQARATETITMLGLRYEDSPLCGEARTALLDAKIAASEKSEAPSVFDWAAFGGGPAPGERAPDATLEGEGGRVRVHELLRGGRHVALLFDGAAATEAGYENLVGIARSLRGRGADAIDAVLVVPRAEAPAAARWEGATLLDPGGEAHRRYGARSECVYVLRPDGYVGFRGQPADGAKLDAWRSTWFAGG